MAKFDLVAAKQAGLSDGQIADFVGGKFGYNTAAARQAGLSDQQIIGEMGSRVSYEASAPTAPLDPGATRQKFINDQSSNAPDEKAAFAASGQVVHFGQNKPVSTMGIATASDTKYAGDVQAAGSRVVNGVIPTLAQKVGGLEQGLGEHMLTQMVIGDDNARDLTASGKALYAGAQEDVDANAPRSFAEEQIAGIAHMLPAVALAAPTGGMSMVADMGLGGYGAKYGANRANGQSIEDSAFSAGATGGAYAMTSQLPIHALLDNPAMGMAKKTLLTSAANTLGMDVAEVASLLADKASVNPNLTLHEALTDLGKTTVSGIVQGAAMPLISKPLEHVTGGFLHRDTDLLAGKVNTAPQLAVDPVAPSQAQPSAADAFNARIAAIKAKSEQPQQAAPEAQPVPRPEPNPQDVPVNTVFKQADGSTVKIVAKPAKDGGYVLLTTTTTPEGHSQTVSSHTPVSGHDVLAAIETARPGQSAEEITAKSVERLQPTAQMAQEAKDAGASYDEFANAFYLNPNFHGITNESGHTDIPATLQHLNNAGHDNLQSYYDTVQPTPVPEVAPAPVQAPAADPSAIVFQGQTFTPETLQAKIAEDTQAAQTLTDRASRMPNKKARAGMMKEAARTLTQVAEAHQALSDATGPEQVSSVDVAAHQAASSPMNELPDPTTAQAKAGTYQKGHVNIHGLDISIENPEGSNRSGVDESGKPWTSTMTDAHYGYVKGTVGADGDHVDVFVKPGLTAETTGDKVFVVDQVDPNTGEHDEHKVLLGFSSKEEAQAAYLSNYDKSGKDRLGAITETDTASFKDWLKNGDTKSEFAPKQEPVKSVEPAKIEVNTGTAPNEKQQAFIRGRVEKFGSIEAVRKAYPDKDASFGQYANDYAAEIYGKKAEQVDAAEPAKVQEPAAKMEAPAPAKAPKDLGKTVADIPGMKDGELKFFRNRLEKAGDLEGVKAAENEQASRAKAVSDAAKGKIAARTADKLARKEVNTGKDEIPVDVKEQPKQEVTATQAQPVESAAAEAFQQGFILDNLGLQSAYEAIRDSTPGKALLDPLQKVANHLYESGKTKFADFREGLKTVLKDAYQKSAVYAKKVFDAAAKLVAPLKSEAGVVGDAKGKFHFPNDEAQPAKLTLGDALKAYSDPTEQAAAEMLLDQTEHPVTSELAKSVLEKVGIPADRIEDMAADLASKWSRLNPEVTPTPTPKNAKVAAAKIERQSETLAGKAMDKIKAGAKTAAEGAAGFGKFIKNLVSPTSGVRREHLSLVHEMKGKAEEVIHLMAGKLATDRKDISQLSKADRVDTLDIIRTSKTRQEAIDRLNEVSPSAARAFAEVEKGNADLIARIQEFKPNFEPKESGHWGFGVQWDKIPGHEERGEGHSFAGSRTLEKNKGWSKQQRLETVSEGIDLGGKLKSDNMVDVAIAYRKKAESYIAAHEFMRDNMADGTFRYFTNEQVAPAGWAEIHDQITKTFGAVLTRPELKDSYVLIDKETGDKIKMNDDLPISKEEAKAAVKENPDLRFEREKGDNPDAKIISGWNVVDGQVERTDKEGNAILDKDGNAKMVDNVVATYGGQSEAQAHADREPGENGDLKVLPRIDKVGALPTGQYYAPEGMARILNNHLSMDAPQAAKAIGKMLTSADLPLDKAVRALQSVKNAYTSVELGLSTFHYTTIAAEALSSSMGLALRKGLTGDIKGAMRDMNVKDSWSIAKLQEAYTRDPEAFMADPEAMKQMKAMLGDTADMGEILHAAFVGGWKGKQDEELRSNALKSVSDAMKDQNSVLSKLSIPLDVADHMSNYLFDTYVPRLKFGQFAKEYQFGLKKYADRIAEGDMTKTELAVETMASVENRYGEMNWDNLFLNRAYRAGLRLMFRSYTWKLGNLRSLGGAIPEQIGEVKRAYDYSAKKNGGEFQWKDFHAELSPKMAWAVALLATNAAMASASMWALTGTPPQDWLDFVFPHSSARNPNARLSMPTYVKEAVSLGHSMSKGRFFLPTDYLASASNGMLAKGYENIKNRDYYGQEVFDKDEDGYITQGVKMALHMAPLPFSVQSARKMIAEGEGGNAAISILGVTKAPHWIDSTPAMRAARDWQDSDPGQKPQSKEDKDHGDLLRKLTGDVREGKGNDSTQSALDEGLISQREVKEIARRATTDPLVQAVNPMPLDNALEVWKKATPDEQEKMQLLMRSKIYQFRQNKSAEQIKDMNERLDKMGL